MFGTIYISISLFAFLRPSILFPTYLLLFFHPLPPPQSQHFFQSPPLPDSTISPLPPSQFQLFFQLPPSFSPPPSSGSSPICLRLECQNRLFLINLPLFYHQARLLMYHNDFCHQSTVPHISRSSAGGRTWGLVFRK